MKVHTNFINWLFHLLIKPQFILFCLALYNLLDVPVRYGATCPYNYQDQLWSAFLLLLAASALWLGKWWGFLGATLLSGNMVYGFVYHALKVFDVLAKTPEEAERLGTPENWVTFMRNYPEMPLQILLAAVIGVFAVVGLARLMFRKRLILS